MLEQFQKALSDAFTLTTLERMVEFKLSKDLYDYAAPGNKQEVIFDLLDAATREGFLEELIVGARAFNPKNDSLREFARQYGLESTGKTTQELERLIVAANENLDPVQLRQWIFEAETRVCRMEISTPLGMKFGTGFLIAPAIVMTNHHVLNEVIAKEVAPDNVICRFDYKRTLARTVERGLECRLAADWLIDRSETGPLDEPTSDQLDYAVVQLSAELPGAADRESVRGYYQLANPPVPAENAALFIMQHPSARAAELAMDTQAVIGPNNAKTRIRYRTNTEAGSSGSPCFTAKFELTALHHSGDPNFDPAHKPAYNQGIPIGLIAARLKAGPHAAKVGLA
jgi:hypothetical protein